MEVVYLDRIFDDALRHPSPGFALGKKLHELHSELALIEGGGDLDVHRYAQEGHCTLAPRGDIYEQYDTAWVGDDGIHRAARITWSNVTWDGTAFQVVVLAWETNRFSNDTRFYILGPSRDRCHALLDAVSRWSHEVRGEILVFNDGCFDKSKKLYEAIKASRFDQLVLDGTLKQQIRDDFTQFLRARATYEEHGVPWKRGALFIGPPGNGKTLCVKALIHELAIPCIYVQSLNAQYATPQHNIESVFRRARSTAPCVLVLEDIDALLVEGSHSYFLNELDGFAINTGVITLATTNHPERLDRSILERPSRFDRKYHFELPSAAARAEYIAAWNQRLRPALRLTTEGIAEIIELTGEFSFAYIQEVFVSSMMRWMTTRDHGGILAVAREQIEQLRSQMQSRAGG